ncbi:MAG: glycosyltransferase family 4 protein [Parcubacteria group bacterium]|jgi:glycosyltransferase involved in cell wall biosynthesis
MKIFHLEFAKIGSGLSGGEKCMLEVIKYLKSREVKNIILTTDNGRKTYEDLGLVEDVFLEYIIITSEWSEKKFYPFISYVIRFFYFTKIKNIILKKVNSNSDVLICHSDFFPNTLFALFVSKLFKRKFYWFHMLAPDIFKGFEGHFTNKFHFPSPSVIHYKLNQILFKLAARQGVVITNSPYYKDLFHENVYNINKYSGVKTVDLDSGGKKYDLAFLGRFHAQKGLFEIPKILKILKQYKPDISLVIMGGGDKKIEKKFLKKITEAGLDENIDYVGFISSDKKFDYLRQSKVFIFPSYYESFGQVALEAMANGLPVIAYDLPVFSVFEKGMAKVPILDNEKFANEIIKSLNNLDSLSIEAKEYAMTFSWDKTGEEIYNLILNK